MPSFMDIDEVTLLAFHLQDAPGQLDSERQGEGTWSLLAKSLDLLAKSSTF